MAGNLSNYAETKLLNHLLTNTTWTQETHLYVGLSTATIADDSSGNDCGETTGTDYVRIEMDSWDAAGGTREINNTDVVTFPEAGSGQAWGTITDWFISETLTTNTGNIIAYGTFEDSGKKVDTGDDASIAAGALTITVDENGMSNFCASAILDHLFKNSAFTSPTALYVGLATGDVADDSSGNDCNEASAGNYARKQCDTWNAPDSATENDDSITFIQADTAWGTITHFFVSTDLANGDILFHGTVDAEKTVGTGDTVQFDADTLTISLD